MDLRLRGDDEPLGAAEISIYPKRGTVGAQFIAPVLKQSGRDDSRPYAIKRIWDN